MGDVLEPGAAGWKAQTNPLSYGVPQNKTSVFSFKMSVCYGSLFRTCFTTTTTTTTTTLRVA